MAPFAGVFVDIGAERDALYVMTSALVDSWYS